jgi:hypothetical protein
VGAFVLASFLLRSRWGLLLEETATDWLVRTWHLVRSDLVPGLVRWILYVFRRLVDGVERVLYTVDEWLRFRRGDSRLSLFVKPALGLVWFVFAYAVRIVINLFVEPTFNPIKHFPVVTVTAKLLLPIDIPLSKLFAASLVPLLGEWAGKLVAWAAVGLLPGLGGFLVWELKENWRLYRANQSPTLDPEIVGHHGETVLRLMRPGLHSGTLPKLYAKLRRAKGRSARRQREALHEVSERLRQFVERDLLAILRTSQTWKGTPSLEVGKIQLSTNRIRMEVRAGEGTGSLVVVLEERAGWLLAGTAPLAAEGSWLSRLTPDQRIVFRDALAGFYKLAGVSLVREQIEAALPSGSAFDVTQEGLLVWPGPDSTQAVVYPLELQTADPSSAPALTTEALLFRTTPVRWEEWAQTWERDSRGEGHPPLIPADMTILE